MMSWWLGKFLPPGSSVVLDPGYNDYKLFAFWTENGIYFVTKTKDNADSTVAEDKDNSSKHHRTL